MSYFNSKFYNNVVINSISTNLVADPTYIYVADGITQTVVLSDEDTSLSNVRDTSNKMVFGKKIVAGNILPMINRHNWTSGNVYSAYDDIDQDLGGKQFFVINSGRSVYKCISNNDGALSTIEPTSLDTTSPVKLADGYMWKYLYRLTVQQLNTYATTDLIPFVVDPNVTSNVVAGTIDYAYVDTLGAQYSAVTEGIVSGKISNNVFRIDNAASIANGIYVDSSFYIQSGTSIGSISRISSYTSNSSGRYVSTVDPLPLVDINSGYYISPSVIIDGDGTGAKLRTIVNPDQSIGVVEVVNNGLNYTSASLTIVANTAYGSGATARAVISPIRGHGFDVPTELFANNLLISITMSGDESATIPIGTSFSKFGLVRNLRTTANTAVVYSSNTFNNTVVVNTTQINGNFVKGDILTSTLLTGVKAVVLKANSTQVTAGYQSKIHFTGFDNLINQSGVTASINSIVQPNINTDFADLLSITNVNTITRGIASQETINVILDV